MMKLLKRASIIIVCCIYWCFGVAQNPVYQANIPLVDSTGYYQIQLSPKLLGTVVRNCIDLRIKNQKGEEQPYFITQEAENNVRQEFITYPIVKQLIKPGGISELIFENKNNQAISQFSLLVNNADVVKEVSLSGSNDMQHWYVLKDKYWLRGLKANKETTVLKMLRFPNSNYSYYKLSINDSVSLPLQINAVGYYSVESELAKTTTYRFENLIQIDSARKSIITLSCDANMYAEKLRVYISGSDYYDRQMTISTKRKQFNRKKEPFLENHVLGSYRLLSDAVNEFSIGRIQQNNLVLTINNFDDKPLKIDSVLTSYSNKYAVVKLFQGESYSLIWGGESISRAKYDIQKFAQKIKPISTLKHSSMEPITQLSANKVISKSWWQSSTIIWIVISVVGVLLSLVAFKMVKEISQR